MIKMIMTSNRMAAANTKRAIPHPGTQSLLPSLLLLLVPDVWGSINKPQVALTARSQSLIHVPEHKLLFLSFDA